MRLLIYDGTFEGLLTVLDGCLSLASLPDGIVSRRELAARETVLFEQPLEVRTSPEAARRAVLLIRKKISDETVRKVYYVYLSGLRDKEMVLARYLLFGLKKGARTDCFLSEGCVRTVVRTFQQVGREAHRMTGLVRFRELSDGVLYAPVETDHLILPLIAPHFSRRLPEERWILHDRKRNQAVIYADRKWQMVEIFTEREPEFSGAEEFYRSLWRQYFHTVAIPQRRNPKLQRQFMPVRYWKHLVEMDTE